MSPLIRRVSLLLAISWMALLFFLSSQSILPGPELFLYQDKVVHAIAYGILGGLLLLSMPAPVGGYTRHQALTATVIASLYGISDEFHQSFVAGREATAGDWMADTSGALLATLALVWLTRRMPSMAR